MILLHFKWICNILKNSRFLWRIFAIFLCVFFNKSWSIWPRFVKCLNLTLVLFILLISFLFSYTLWSTASRQGIHFSSEWTCRYHVVCATDLHPYNVKKINHNYIIQKDTLKKNSDDDYEYYDVHNSMWTELK